MTHIVLSRDLIFVSEVCSYILLIQWAFSCAFLECGGVLNNPEGGNFTSPGYLVSNYSNNLNCEWLIQNPQQVNSSIVVLIEDLHLETHQTCSSDYLQFRLGESFSNFSFSICVVNHRKDNVVQVTVVGYILS